MFKIDKDITRARDEQNVATRRQVEIPRVLPEQNRCYTVLGKRQHIIRIAERLLHFRARQLLHIRERFSVLVTFAGNTNDEFCLGTEKRRIRDSYHDDVDRSRVCYFDVQRTLSSWNVILRFMISQNIEKQIERALNFPRTVPYLISIFPGNSDSRYQGVSRQKFVVNRFKFRIIRSISAIFKLQRAFLNDKEHVSRLELQESIVETVVHVRVYALSARHARARQR